MHANKGWMGEWGSWTAQRRRRSLETSSASPLMILLLSIFFYIITTILSSVPKQSKAMTRQGNRSMALVAAVAVAVAASLAGAAAAADKAGGFVVTGRVYCDPCRAGFETNVSRSVGGATVEVVCRHFGASKETLKAEATTDDYGWYKLEIDQDHQEEICEVVLKKSSDPKCGEIEESRARARVPLTSNNGIKQKGVRYANPIAFFRKNPLKECGGLLQKYDLKDANDTP